MKSEKRTPDVVGALQAIRLKKSREQIKSARLHPFVPVIDEALAHGWKWSPIVTLIRESGGPCLTKREAELLYAELKEQVVRNGSGNDYDKPIDQPANSMPKSGNEEVVA
ncbi:hypothetical protein WJ542_05450 [Paraburkholderia sp. B3]|uniref:hypothetical protein n=1 Tax=Paraburkholderia sp. B3 TaxID=3134791 RepID=UPI003981C301